MKTSIHGHPHRLWQTVFLWTALLLACTARAQPTVDWLTLDAGGGVQISANYTANFTLGQFDVGAAGSSSARYRIITGFWALQDFGPARGRPELSIVVSGPNVILSWPSPSTGFVLEQTDSLNAIPATWSDTMGLVSDNGLIKSITIAHDVAKRFYRLRKP